MFGIWRFLELLVLISVLPPREFDPLSLVWTFVAASFSFGLSPILSRYEEHLWETHSVSLTVRRLNGM